MQAQTRYELHYGDRRVRCFSERPPHIDQLFTAAVQKNPECVALVINEERLSYRQLEQCVANVAGNLLAKDFHKGERLALLAGNCVEFVVTVLAAARIGVIVVPMNILQRRLETTFMLTHCAASGLVVDAACIDELPDRAEVPSLKHVFQIGLAANAEAQPFEALLSDAPSVAPGAPGAVHEEDGFCILYTSGTTGRPKGALLTHFGVIHSLLHYQYGFGLRDGCISVLAVPASHVTGLVAIILATIRMAGTTVVMQAFKAHSFLQLAARERMNYTLMVPAMYNLCLLDPELANFDLTAWEVGGFGGAPMPEVTIDRLGDALPRLKLANVYGATETTSPATLLPPGEAASHQDSVGRILPCAVILVCDQDGQELEPGKPGELRIAGPMTIPGYWNDTDANRSSFVDGFWLSGDIGSVDSDGYVHIFDRIKDVINRGGYKIYCQEVEHVLAVHPLVLECAVVARPDEVLGERVHAFIVPHSSGVEPEALRAFCARRLSEYKVPESFTILDEPLPRNANGKVLKADLRRSAALLVVDRPSS